MYSPLSYSMVDTLRRSGEAYTVQVVSCSFPYYAIIYEAAMLAKYGSPTWFRIMRAAAARQMRFYFGDDGSRIVDLDIAKNKRFV